MGCTLEQLVLLLCVYRRVRDCLLGHHLPLFYSGVKLLLLILDKQPQLTLLLDSARAALVDHPLEHLCGLDRGLLPVIDYFVHGLLLAVHALFKRAHLFGKLF